jgi:hypothetical protein
MAFPTLNNNIGNTILPPTNLRVAFDPDNGTIASHRRLNVYFTTSSSGGLQRFYEAKLYKYEISPAKRLIDVDGDGITILNPSVVRNSSTQSNTALGPPTYRIFDVYENYTYYLRLRTALNDGRYREDWVGPIDGKTPSGIQINESGALGLGAEVTGTPKNDVTFSWSYPSQFVEIRFNDSDGAVIATPINDTVSSPGTTTYPLEYTVEDLSDGTYTFYVNAYRTFPDSTISSIIIDTTIPEGGEKGGGVVPCFLKGTRVLTPKGYKAIETFKDGDLIVTADNRIVPVTMSVRKVRKTTEATAPYRIPQNLFGKGIPSTDVEISPEHAIMIRPNVWTIPKMLAMVTKKVRQIKIGESVDYYHLEAPEYLKDNMIVEGMIAETYGGKYRGKVCYFLSNEQGGLVRILHQGTSVKETK